ncbi:restriction system protein [Murinocardiopsis flavida]|uniref:Restriction system protein n=1 Tax=Murinocardiopsis flavida TaxID=645275 RepID=A0A2P8DP61_9ACTN|nr:CBS domain-containing protein [Murinocardiopsis flavida]PSK99017.1 restriction system protein [Murinocardiopsis flavida]
MEFPSSPVPAAWLVRAGRDGEREKEALEVGLAIAGWHELDDLSVFATREGLREYVRATYPHAGTALVGNWTGQLWRFCSQIAVGDHIVMPMKTRPGVVAVGRVTAEYRYRADSPVGFQHVRPVEWLRTDIAKAAIRQDLLDSMGSLLTVCGLTRYDAARRVAALAERGIDPGASDDVGADIAVQNSRDLLNEAARRDANDPVRMTVRDFLDRWGLVRRGSTSVERVTADLAEQGLTTRPPFPDVGIDSTIDIIQVGEEPTLKFALTEAQTAEDTKDASEMPSVSLHVGALPAANQGVASVRPDDTLKQATTTMLTKRYSQLAVIDGDGKLHGAVSWQSIAEAWINDPGAPLTKAIARSKPAAFDEPLLDLIKPISENDFVFVLGADKVSIVGIVTAADLTQRFGDHAGPFVLLEEIERRLRQVVDNSVPRDQITKHARDKKLASLHGASALTMGNYCRLLSDADNWQRLAWSIDHALFLHELDEVRNIRNETMHFSADPIQKDHIRRLDGFLNLIRTVTPDF